VLITEPGKEHESVLRLARVGFENVAGYLEGGIDTWKKGGKSTGTIASIEAGQVPAYVSSGYEILDVRRSSEAETEHVAGAINISLMDLENRMKELSKTGKYVLHCAGGYRSMIASSILRSRGFSNFVNVHGGFAKISKVPGIEIIAGKCPTTLRNEKLATLKFNAV